MRYLPLLVLAALLLGLIAGSNAAGEDKKKTLPAPSPFKSTVQKGPSRAANLGEAVNSSASDFGPIIEPDGNALYFTSDRPGGMGGQDVWLSRRVKGEWQEAVNLGEPINTGGDEGPDCFSLSEKALYFTACDREGGRGGCDIYASYRLRDKWSKPENLGEPVNTPHNESNASISSSGDFIIFTSDRPGGLGGQDLWIAQRGETIRVLRPGFSTSGRWKKPKNLGKNVNTPDWEGVGFLMPDDRTLYFSSRGRGGHGLADIFKSVRKEDGWTRAENMGEIINTTRDDIYFTLPGSGDLAYFSSDVSGGLGMEDIYSIPIPLLIPEKRLVVIRGKVVDGRSGRPVKARVKVTQPSTGAVLAQVESDPASGSFQVIVKEPKVEIEVKNEEHKVFSEVMDAGKEGACSMIFRDIRLQKEQQ